MTDVTLFEVAIIGAGPGGLGAATRAAHLKLSHVLIEQAEVGNTIYNYQLRKHVMAEPSKLPLRAHVKFEAGSREKILEDWNVAIRDLGVNLKKGKVSQIVRENDVFKITVDGTPIQARHVVLAIGTQGTPRRVEVPGGELPHIYYTLADPDAVTGKDVLVIGAGDSAIENALALCDHNRVSILNRSAEFARAKEANNAKILSAINAGKIQPLYNAELVRVENDKVLVATPNGDMSIPCNHVIARLGSIMPRKFLEGCGIKFPNAEPTTPPIVNSKYESSVPGLFIVGALIGYPLIKQAINQGYEVIEHIRGEPIQPADQGILEEKLRALAGTVEENIAFMRETLLLFSDLTDPQFRELIAESTVRVFRANEVVFNKNDYTDSFFSILSGSVSAEVGQGSVNIPTGDFFGEMGLISGRRRTATIRAVKNDTVLLETPRKQILKLISSVDSIRERMDRVFLFRALQTSILPGVDAGALIEMIKDAKPKRFKKGEILFREGDIGDVLYLIRKGSVKVSRKNALGVDVVQTYIPAGNYVGEMALLDANAKRSATVSAAVGCDTIVIEKAAFLKVLDSHPAVKERVQTLARARKIENVTEDQNESEGKLLDFMFMQGVTDADNFLMIDSDLCVSCDNCEKACAATHNGFSRLDRKGGKSFASVQVPVSCRHCENPLCMLDCPPDALARMPNGEVVIRDTCIGCGNCQHNCPYGVIQMVYDSGSGGFSLWDLLMGKKAKEKGPAKAAKCDMCGHLEGGPACVRSCPTGAAMRVNPNRLLTFINQKGGPA